MKDVKILCMLIGVIFGFLINLNTFFVIPSSIALIIAGIQMFEYSYKQKKLLKDSLQSKLRVQDEKIEFLKKEAEKLKSDIESLKMRQGFSQIK